MFEEYFDCIRLYGESYDMLKSLILYSVVGNTLKHNIIRIGGLYADTRVNFAIPIRSGYGKREIKTFIRTVQYKLGRSHVEPTSLHPEQLVGKVLLLVNEKGEMQFKVNKGFLAEDFVIFDEAIELLTDKSFSIARDYINIALDPIGENEILKKSVDIDSEHAIKYIPICSVGFLFHPIKVPESIISRGFLRRVIIGYITPSIYERMFALEQSVNKESYIPDEFIYKLNKLQQSAFKWEMNTSSLIAYTKKLIEEGLRGSSKIIDFTDVMWFTLRDRLATLSAIIAGFNENNMITTNYINKAYNDFIQFWSSQMLYIDENVVQKDGIAPILWHRQHTGLSILREYNATSFENSRLHIDTYIKELASRLQISLGSARLYLQQLIRQGLVKEQNSFVYLNEKFVNNKEKEVWENMYG